VREALAARAADTSQATVVLGAGECTEIPLQELVQASDEVAIVDLDDQGIEAAKRELPLRAQKKVRLVQWDLSGGVSLALRREISKRSWQAAKHAGPRALWDLAADCLDTCKIAVLPEGGAFVEREFGLVISSFVMTQLFSYPLLDMLDHMQALAPELLEEQERHRRYQDARQHFQKRIIEAHLRLMAHLLDTGGVALLLSDVRGFAFMVHGTDHDRVHRQMFPLVPRSFSELVSERFQIIDEQQWEWLTSLPEKDRPGRGYEVSSYLCQEKDV
jgi:hypothetical protein